MILLNEAMAISVCPSKRISTYLRGTATVKYVKDIKPGDHLPFPGSDAVAEQELRGITADLVGGCTGE